MLNVKCYKIWNNIIYTNIYTIASENQAVPSDKEKNFTQSGQTGQKVLKAKSQVCMYNYLFIYVYFNISSSVAIVTTGSSILLFYYEIQLSRLIVFLLFMQANTKQPQYTMMHTTVHSQYFIFVW